MLRREAIRAPAASRHGGRRRRNRHQLPASARSTSTIRYLQYLPQILYSSSEPRKVKGTSVMSWKPSLTRGSVYRLAKPANADSGNPCRDSGFSSLFCERTASLCWHICCGVLNQTQRSGMFSSRATSIQTARVSTSALVLSI